jgi:pyridoxamine 5'-phosphate oxidase
VSDFAALREGDLDPDPLRQFERWYREASDAVGAPEAMAVASATPDGRPSVRMVLMKGFDERGFVFFTNYGSRKGAELGANPQAALLFHWEPLGRQVRIEGGVGQISAEESEAYVRSRPRESQLSALASPQSRPIETREELELRVADIAARHEGSELPLPRAWGGFRVEPSRYEFWQHRANRLHDRLSYTRATGGAWLLERLAP